MNHPTTIPTAPLEPRISIPLKRGDRLLAHPNELLYCIAEGSYAVLHMEDGRRHVSTRNLLATERALPVGMFQRTGRGTLVNLNHVREYRRNGDLTMLDGKVLRTTKQYREVLARTLRENYHIIR